MLIFFLNHSIADFAVEIFRPQKYQIETDTCLRHLQRNDYLFSPKTHHLMNGILLSTS